MALRIVWWRLTAVRRPPVSMRKRRSRCAAISAGVIDRRRAAASSIASGSPSRRRHRVAMSGRWSSGAEWSPVTSAARVTNNRTASDVEQPVECGVAIGQPQDRHGEDVLAAYPESLAARRHDVQTGCARQRGLDELGRRGDEVLAVVEDQHELLVA